VNTNERDPDDLDDPFQDTRMTFWDHIEVLRTHMWRAIIGFVIALCLSFFVGEMVVEIIARPVEKELMTFYNRRVAEAVKKSKEKLEMGDPEMIAANAPRPMSLELSREHLQQLRQGLGIAGEVPRNQPPVELMVGIRPVEIGIAIGVAQQMVGRPPLLKTFTILEGFVVFFKVCMYCGVVLASPWIFYQLWSFVAAGLYPHEKRCINVYLPISLGLFLAGVLLCEIVVIPTSIRYLLSFNEWMGLDPELRLSDWLHFAIMLPLTFGVSFQLPLLMLFLNRVGIFDVAVYRSKRRMAYFLIACSYLIIGASPDAINMMLLTVPLWGLYELGILLCHLSPPPPEDDLNSDLPDLGAMVGV
jgi:sec-independent protein translocase protein TatC